MARSHWNDGENNGRAKLTTFDVHLIRVLLNNGLSAASIARMRGVHHSTIGLIKLRKTWKDVP